MELAKKVNPSNNFELKNTSVELINPGRFSSESHSIQALEEMRSGNRSVPASKHGIEAICGASCETGAQ